MSIPNPTVGLSYTIAADITAPSIPYDFKIEDDDDIKVIRVDPDGVPTTLTKSTHYTVSNVGAKAGGSINMVGAYLATEKVVVIPNASPIQSTTMSYAGTWPSVDIETAFDYVTNLIKRLFNRSERAVRLPPEDYGDDPTLPTRAARKGKYLYGNISTGDIEMVDGTGYGYAAYGAAQQKNVGIGATVEFFQVTLPTEAKSVVLKLRAMAGVLGYTLEQDYVLLLETGGGSVTIDAGVAQPSKVSGVTQSFTFSLSVSGTNTVLVRIDGTNLTTAYDIDFRISIQTMENAATAGLSLS